MSKEKMFEKLMDIVEYYMIQIDHIQILTKLGNKYLFDFPEELPREIREAIKVDNESVRRALIVSAAFVTSHKNASDGFLKSLIEIGSDSLNLKEDISYPIIHLMKRKDQITI